jgi:hypothetical protein
MLPKPTLALAAIDASVLMDSAGANELIAVLRLELATALEIPVSDITQLNLRLAAVSDGRRRVQSDQSVLVDFVLNTPDSPAVVQNLTAQLADPGSVLRGLPTMGRIDTTKHQTFGFTCQPGAHKPEGAANCEPCGASSVPSPDDITRCQECPDRQAPDPLSSGATCACAAGYYNTSAACTHCHAGDFAGVAVQNDCESRVGMEDCLDDCRGHTLEIAAGWGVVEQSDGRVAVFECKSTSACPGGTISGDSNSDNTIGCNTGHLLSSVLCGACSTGYALQRDNTCSECGNTSSFRVALAVVLLIVAAAVLGYTMKRWYATVLVARYAMGWMKELNVKATLKVIVATMQIIGNLAGVLRIQFPDVFRSLLGAILSVFNFDITFQLGLGCLTGGSYVASLATSLAMVVVVAVGVACAYVYGMYCIRRDSASVDTSMHMEYVRALYMKIGGGDNITLPTVQTLLEALDLAASPEIMAALFERADADGSGSIDFEAFHDALVHPDAGFKLDLASLIKRDQQQAARADAFARVSLLLFMLYPMITNKIFKGFDCRDLGSGLAVLDVDYNVECSSPEYAVLESVCYGLVMLWPIGLPTVLFLSM